LYCQQDYNIIFKIIKESAYNGQSTIGVAKC
jgi:hypothetical protein